MRRAMFLRLMEIDVEVETVVPSMQKESCRVGGISMMTHPGLLYL